MRILQVFSFFSLPHGGGTVEVIYKLSKALMQSGHEVTVYTSDFELDQEYIDSLRGVKVQLFHSWLDLLGLHLTPSLIMEAKTKLTDFDIIHLHGNRSVQTIIIHHYAKKYGIPYILQAHGSVLPMFQKQRLKKFFDRLFGYAILRDASKLIALTETEVKHYKKMGVDDKKIEIVPNGIDLSEYDNLPERGEFRRKYGMGDNEKIILYLGRIHKIKGIDLLVEAFADLIKEVDDVRLVIVGQDDCFLSTLKKQIEDLGIGNRILFTGPLYGMDKLEAYVDADVYVLPSIYEIWGLTALEACACGTPVIVTDMCGIADIIGGNVGYVVEYDKNKLRNVIIKVLSDDESRRRFGKDGRKLVREAFGWLAIIKQIEKIYKDATKRVIR